MENLNIKYLPKEIDDCFISNRNKSIINRMIKNKNFSNTIFYGGIGYGKSCVINIILKHMEDFNVVKLNMLLYGNEIKTIFSSLERTCAYNKRIHKKTVFVINDFHLLKPKIQNNFFVFLNKLKDDVILFIETTNLMDIVKNIQDVMNIIKFSDMGKKRYKEFVNNISKKEEIEINDDVINQMFIITNGDIKNTLNQIMALKIVINNHNEKLITKEIFESVFSIPSSITIHKIINGIIDGERETVMNECDNLIREKFDCNEILLKLFNEVIDEDIEEDDKHVILEKLGKQIYKFNKYQENNNKLKEYIKEIMDLF